MKKLWFSVALAACAHAPSAQEGHWVVAESPEAGVRVLLPPGDWTVELRGDGLSAVAGDRYALVELDKVSGTPGEPECEARFRSRHPAVPEGIATAFRVGEGRCLVVALTGPVEQARAMAASAEVSEAQDAPPPHGAAATSSDFARELEQLLREGRFKEALPRLETLVAADPDNVHLRFWAGQAAMSAEKVPRAIEHFQAALAMHKQLVAAGGDGLGEHLLPQTMESLGIAYSKAHQLDKASDMLGELTVRFPEYGQGFYNFACVLALKGDKGGALNNLDRALEETPELAEHARGDEDFVSLRGSDEFEAVLKKHEGAGR